MKVVDHKIIMTPYQGRVIYCLHSGWLLLVLVSVSVIFVCVCMCYGPQLGLVVQA